MSGWDEGQINYAQQGFRDEDEAHEELPNHGASKDSYPRWPAPHHQPTVRRRREAVA